MKAMAGAAVVLAAVGWMLAACGGRPASPVATVQPADDKMNCQLLQAEFGSNESRARTLAGEKTEAEQQNAAKVAGVLLVGLPALLTVDTQKTEETEIRALNERNDYLARLMATKACPNAPAPVQPVKAPESETTAQSESSAEKAPNCRDVGGYEAYLKKTGKTCML
jgi:hypothetical protein